MIDDHILITKLIVPDSQHSVVPRARLAEAGLPQLTVVCAAAGYGKTVLMAAWARRGDRPAAWLSLDAADNDPVRFMLHFIAAIQRIFPRFGAAIADALQSSQPPSATAAVQLLINQISALPGEVLMVMDDYHVIAQAEVHDAMAYLVRHQPPQLRLVIGSRSAVPLPLSRLRAQGRLREVDASDLRFTPQEVARFMREGMALELAPEEIGIIEARTEGWVAGLQLAALSLRHQPDRAAFIRRFNGRNVHVAEFLADEVLPLQPPAVEEFLLRTSVLPRFCPSLCDAVTGGGNSREIIDQLERQNLFLFRLDSENTWYRYHHLFASLLRSRLDALMPGARAALHLRAAQWHAAHAAPSEAIEHALAARDVEYAADLIERHGYELSSHGRTGAILGWAKSLPRETLARRPALCLTCAWSNFFINDMAGLKYYIGMAESSLADRKEPWTEQEKVMLGQTALLRSSQKRYLGDSEGAMRLARHAIQFFSPGRVLHGAALGCVAICHLMRGEAGMAIACFEKITDISPQQRNLLVPLTAVLGLARAYLLSGRLQAAEAVYQRALRQCTECGWQDLPVCGMLHIGLGELDYERNALAQAEQRLARGVAMTSKGVQYISDWGTILLAQVRSANGAAQSALPREAELELSKYLNTHVIDVQRPAISLLRLWLQQGRTDRVGEWLKHRNFAGSDAIDAEYEQEYLIYARWLITAQRCQEARKVLAQLGPAAEAAGRGSVLIEIAVLDALALHGMQQLEAALAALQTALELAQPERFMRVFINEGAEMGALLQRFVLSGATDSAGSYARELLDAFRDAPSLVLADAAEPLTPKEEKIIQCLVQDLSNQKIADTLFVSLNTVKTHLKNVYRKLGVNSRREAIERIRRSALS